MEEDNMSLRREDELPEHVIDRIAERAAEKALEKVYTEIGRSVANRVLWLVGVCALAAFAWLGGKGQIPGP